MRFLIQRLLHQTPRRLIRWNISCANVGYNSFTLTYKFFDPPSRASFFACLDTVLIQSLTTDVLAFPFLLFLLSLLSLVVLLL